MNSFSSFMCLLMVANLLLLLWIRLKWLDPLRLWQILFNNKVSLCLQHIGLAEIMKYNPYKFIRNTNLDVANKWFRGVGKIFRETYCLENRKVSFATYLLSNELEFWWIGMQQMMEARNKTLDQKNFIRRFLQKYFLDNAIYAKELEILRLEQGGLTIHEYATRFKHLTIFTHVKQMGVPSPFINFLS